MLGVFYESMCPDSKKFIVSQLQHAYSKLKDIMFLELVPYGNAEVCKTSMAVLYTGF